jgi:hypothetical protein
VICVGHQVGQGAKSKRLRRARMKETIHLHRMLVGKSVGKHALEISRRRRYGNIKK